MDSEQVSKELEDKCYVQVAGSSAVSERLGALLACAKSMAGSLLKVWAAILAACTEGHRAFTLQLQSG